MRSSVVPGCLMSIQIVKAKCLVAEARACIVLQNRSGGNYFAAMFFNEAAFRAPMHRRHCVWFSRVLMYLFLQIQRETTVVLGFSTHLPFFWYVFEGKFMR